MKNFSSICPLLTSLYMSLPEIYIRAVLSLHLFSSSAPSLNQQILHFRHSPEHHPSLSIYQALAYPNKTTKMQYTTILSVLSLAMAATAAPNSPPPPPSPTCDAGSVVACCDSIDNQGVGINCLASSTF